MKRLLVIAIVIATFLLVLVGYSNKSTVEVSEPEVEQEAPPKPVTTTVTIASIGDILIHDRVYVEAETEDGVYDFTSMLAPVKPMLTEPDFLIANQESMPGGAELGVSSYPSFNSPHEITDALIDCGVDLFSQANNHTLDKGTEEIESAINYYNQKGVPYVGMYESAEDQATSRVFDVNGISVGVMAYTYGTNGIEPPEGQEYLVNYIDEEQMKAEAEKLQEEADIVIAIIHWGNEYETYPSEYQQQTAQFLADCGVDIIFGSHPHVLQPIEWITAADGTETLCVYSLGNFLSGQTGDLKDVGGMVEVTVSETVTEEETIITIDQVEFYPTYVTTQGPDKYMVVPMSEAPNYGLSSPTEAEVYNFVMEGVNDDMPKVIHKTSATESY